MIADELSAENQIRVTEENLWGLWRRFGLAPGCTLHEDNGAVWFETPLTHLPYNGVIRFQVAGEAEPLVDRVVGHFRARGVPFVWIVHPSALPVDIERLLGARGLVLAEAIPGMTMDLAALPPREAYPADVEIREALTQEDLAGIQEMIAWRWDIPDQDRQIHLDMMLSFGVGTPGSSLRCWAAYIDGTPVSKVLLNLDAGAAGIHGVATKPEARGKGLARTLTLEALHTGRETGFRLAMLHTSTMARSLYEKIGFRQVSEFRVYADGGELHV